MKKYRILQRKVVTDDEVSEETYSIQGKWLFWWLTIRFYLFEVMSGTRVSGTRVRKPTKEKYFSKSTAMAIKDKIQESGVKFDHNGLSLTICIARNEQSYFENVLYFSHYEVDEDIYGDPLYFVKLYASINDVPTSDNKKKVVKKEVVRWTSP